MADLLILLRRIASYCWTKALHCLNGEDYDLQSKDNIGYQKGTLSIAAVHDHYPPHEFVQVVSASSLTFLGIYDGHMGYQASTYVCENILNHVLNLAERSKMVSEHVLGEAIVATESGYQELVRASNDPNGAFSTVGSCCLIAILWKNRIFLANLGDSEAVVGRFRLNKMIAVPLNSIHNTRSFDERNRYENEHPEDPMPLKLNEYRVNEKKSRFYYESDPLFRPLLSSEPETFSYILEDDDNFLIVASHGFWAHLSKDEAVHIVHNYPRMGIAARLVNRAMNKALIIERSWRPTMGRGHPDDMTVVVIFMDWKIRAPAGSAGVYLSVRSSEDGRLIEDKITDDDSMVGEHLRRLGDLNTMLELDKIAARNERRSARRQLRADLGFLV